MKVIISMMLLLVLCSCSSFRGELNETDEQIDKEFRPYAIEFQRQFKVRVRVPMMFTDEEVHYAGVCISAQDGYREIRVKRSEWKKISEAQKENLIIHELGHCVLGLPHVDGQYMISGCPLSIMNPRLFTKHQAKDCYSRHKDYYISQIKVALGL